MKDLVILGAGVHAGEMVEIVERINRENPAWNLLGFIAANDKSAGKTLNGLPVLGAKAALADFPQACLVPDNSWPRAEPAPRERLVSLVDPSAFVSRTALIGQGCVIYPGCFVGLNARIGDYCFCLSGCAINHDDVIEENVTLASSVTLAGAVHVGTGCYLGQGCLVRQHLRIGRNSLVGMGAVVVKEVPPDSVMAGNPARKIKDRERPSG